MDVLPVPAPLLPMMTDMIGASYVKRKLCVEPAAVPIISASLM
jgi:hypothetical protein